MDESLKREKNRLASARWYKSEKGIAYRKKWRAENRDRLRKLASDHYKNNREHYRRRRAEYYKLHKPDFQLRSKKEHANHGRERYLKWKYSLTLEQYRKMYDDQIGLCAICGKRETKGTPLSVDHCHKTGKIRGLICDKCNVGLGRFNDDKNLLLRAAKYLGDHE